MAPLAVLVAMPFMAADRPSIQLGLLKAVAGANGYSVDTLHANLDFAVRLGDDYAALCDHRGVMLGDWLFSVEAFGVQAPDPEGRLAGEFADRLGGLSRDRLLRIRDRDVPEYLAALLDAYPWGEVAAVAFSSTFQQNTASFALARRLKERHPGLRTVFGGANFDGEMGLEYVRAVPAVDLAVLGEADTAFPRLLAALAGEADLGDVPGLARRVDGRVVCTPPAPPVDALDTLPDPDYDEYFRRALGLGLRTAATRTWIPFESARGCWWGAKHHCVFCGLNAASMRFRAKSPERVLDELGRQARRYHGFHFTAVDNILDPGYLTKLFPTIVDAGLGYQLFYEVKSNLTRAQVGLLARAGVTHLQPGVESLSTRVLSLMRKGVTAAQNVNLLRWARYYGIDVAWNLLWGIPGETEADYAGQAAALPLLRHLQPPDSMGRVWMERFSPLYASDVGRTPERSYRYVYPAAVDLGKVAYFFDHESPDELPEVVYHGVRGAVRDWCSAWADGGRPVLTCRSTPGLVQIYDGRWPGRERTFTLEGTAADAYTACLDRPISASAVRERLASRPAVGEVREMFAEFHRLGLMWLEGASGLALALPAVGGR